MSIEIKPDETTSLWECLHDGIPQLNIDPLARTVEIVVDVPYLCEFHHMPEETRFRIAIEEVSTVEALEFSPWPVELVIPKELSWKESEKLRWEHSEKGCWQSTDWEIMATKLHRSEDYDISNASILAHADNTNTLTLDLRHDERVEFPQLRISGKKVHFWLGSDQELTLQEFLAFGVAYWEAFASQTIKASN